MIVMIYCKCKYLEETDQIQLFFMDSSKDDEVIGKPCFPSEMFPDEVSLKRHIAGIIADIEERKKNKEKELALAKKKNENKKKLFSKIEGENISVEPIVNDILTERACDAIRERAARKGIKVEQAKKEIAKEYKDIGVSPLVDIAKLEVPPVEAKRV